MALVFHDGKFMPEQYISKYNEEAAVLRRLRAFLDAREPGLVRILVNTWRSQGNAITYKELREAILAGEISADLLEEWMQDYNRFVIKYLQPIWEKAIQTAAKAIEEKYPLWNFDPMGAGVQEWTAAHSAEFVTNVTTTQIEGLRAVVRRAAVLEDMSVDQLARAIRPMVGLYKQQTVANLNYYETLIKGGMSEARALDKSIRYAAKQHRYRAYNIARTELAFAYNQGSYEGTKQAQAAGYMGEAVKIWCTADDERTCSICSALEGKEIAMDEDFDFHTKLEGRNPTIKRVPPAHPSCRCAVMYKEIATPIIKPQQSNTNGWGPVV